VKNIRRTKEAAN